MPATTVEGFSRVSKEAYRLRQSYESRLDDMSRAFCGAPIRGIGSSARKEAMP
jgi:hypothetical protein